MCQQYLKSTWNSFYCVGMEIAWKVIKHWPPPWVLLRRWLTFSSSTGHTGGHYVLCDIPIRDRGTYQENTRKPSFNKKSIVSRFRFPKNVLVVHREWDFLLPPRLKIEEKGPKWLQGAEVELANSHAEWWIFQLYVEKQLKLWFYKLPPARFAAVRKNQINTILEKRRKN